MALEPEELEDQEHEDDELEDRRRRQRRVLGRLLVRVKEPLGWWRILFRRRHGGRGGKPP